MTVKQTWHRRMRQAPLDRPLDYGDYPVEDPVWPPPLTGTVEWSYGLYEMFGTAALFDTGRKKPRERHLQGENIEQTLRRVVEMVDRPDVEPLGWWRLGDKPRREDDGRSIPQWYLYLSDKIALAGDLAAYAEWLGRDNNCAWRTSEGDEIAAYWSRGQVRPVAVIMPMMNTSTWAENVERAPSGVMWLPGGSRKS